MIKTFEQFVSAKYGKPVNEGFQSNKLRAIIKQHGLPKNDWDKKMLYDLQDNEIIDVVDNRKEYSAKYMSTPLSKIDWSEEQTFIMKIWRRTMRWRISMPCILTTTTTMAR